MDALIQALVELVGELVVDVVLFLVVVACVFWVKGLAVREIDAFFERGLIVSGKYIALKRDILVVAGFGHPVGTWCAFIDVVPGRCHDDEWKAVTDVGCRLSEDLARFLFPELHSMPYGR